MKALFLAAVVLLFGSEPALAQQSGRRAGNGIDTLLLRTITRTLAHDSLAGRDTGSPGAAAAARYIAGQLRALELEPGGANGAFAHAVPIFERSVDAESRLMLGSGPESTAFAYGRDFFALLPDTFESRPLSGEPWFLGMDDDAATAIPAADVRGRLPVVLGGLPEPSDSLLRVWAAHGAAAVLLLIPDSAAFAAARRGFGAPQLVLPGADRLRPGPELPLLVAGNAVARAVLEGVSVPPRIAGQPFRAVRMPTHVAAVIRLRRDPVDAANVLGIIPGQDPARRHEFVVFTAHYDHVGIGTPDATGDSIYNGFSDNAAGVAMLLSIADVLRRDPPARSVAFLFLAGEERGLLGSFHAAAAPPWPGGLDAVRAVINLDGGAPPRAPISWRIAGGLEKDGSTSDLGALATDIAAANGWTIRLETARPNSDYWPFAERGVPAIFIIPGNQWEATSAEERTGLMERWDRYHQPGDEYREDFPFGGLQRYADLALAVGLAIASAR